LYIWENIVFLWSAFLEYESVIEILYIDKLTKKFKTEQIIMTLGKSIRIYLKNGTVSGIKLAEIVNHTIQALSCSRNNITDLNSIFNKESNRPGVYFLFGDDDSTLNKVYIGEAENVWERLKNHDTKKDFWNEIILFTSKDENLTKSHVKYLESRLVKIANDAERYKLENINLPTTSSLPMSDKDAMEDFILNVKLLTGTLGHKFLEDPITQYPTIDIDSQNENNAKIITSQSIELELNSRGVKAKALQTNEGIVVLENSMVSETNTPSSYSTLRTKLIAEKVIKKAPDGNIYFSKNYLFDSPSAAASVIAGNSVNGRISWKNKNGKTLKSIEQLQIGD
jgi:hypothetical protein